MLDDQTIIDCIENAIKECKDSNLSLSSLILSKLKNANYYNLAKLTLNVERLRYYLILAQPYYCDNECQKRIDKILSESMFQEIFIVRYLNEKPWKIENNKIVEYEGEWK